MTQLEKVLKNKPDVASAERYLLKSEYNSSEISDKYKLLIEMIANENYTESEAAFGVVIVQGNIEPLLEIKRNLILDLKTIEVYKATYKCSNLVKCIEKIRSFEDEEVDEGTSEENPTTKITPAPPEAEKAIDKNSQEYTELEANKKPTVWEEGQLLQ